MCKSMIPKKTIGLELALGVEKSVETNGYDCKLLVYSGEVYVKTCKAAADSDAFILKEGQTLVFCGEVSIKAKANANVRMIMFDRL